MAERRPPVTQEELARLAGATQPAVVGWLKGAVPYARTLNRICLALGIRRDWLLYGEGKKYLPKGAGVAEMPAEYSRQEKISFIEERATPEQLALIDSFLESVREQLGAEPASKPAKRPRRSLR